MAIGDDAVAAGMALVPDTGSEDAKVRYGAREINRTRDYIAAVKTSIMATWSITRGGTGGTTASAARTNLGFTSGTAAPTGGSSGDVYFKIIG